MKRLLIAVAIAASFALPAAVSAAPVSPCPANSYCDVFGHVYSAAEMHAFCAALRPGSATYVRYDCAYWVTQ